MIAQLTHDRHRIGRTILSMLSDEAAAIIPSSIQSLDFRHQPATLRQGGFPKGRCGLSNDGQLPSNSEIVDEIRSRNELRTQFGLPPVELDRELDSIQQFRERQDFERWIHSPLRYRVQQKLLQRIRRRLKQPDWQPTGFLSGGGFAFHVELVKQMKRLRAQFGQMNGKRTI